MLPRARLRAAAAHAGPARGSDFASGNVLTGRPGGTHQSALHAQAIKGRRIGTHITKTPQLLYDVSVWNKLFRKSFWDRPGLYLPGRHALGRPPGHDQGARARQGRGRDPDPIYYWRERGKGALSITQSRTDIRTSVTGSPRCSPSTVPAPRTPRRSCSASISARRWSTTSGCTSAIFTGPATATATEFIELAGQLPGPGRQARARQAPVNPQARVLPGQAADAGPSSSASSPVAARAAGPRRSRCVQAPRQAPSPTCRSSATAQAGLPARVYRPYWRELDPVRPGRGPRLARRQAGHRRPAPTCLRSTSASAGTLPRSWSCARAASRRPPIVLPARSFRHP